MVKRPFSGEPAFFAFPFQGLQIQVIVLPIPGLEQGIGIEPTFSHYQIEGMEIIRVASRRPLVQHQRRLENRAPYSRRRCCSGCPYARPAQDHWLVSQLPFPEKECPVLEAPAARQSPPQLGDFQFHGSLQ